MTTQELYNLYLTKKAEVSILQNQMIATGQQLYIAETELNTVSQQIRDIADSALLNSLGL